MPLIKAAIIDQNTALLSPTLLHGFISRNCHLVVHRKGRTETTSVFNNKVSKQTGKSPYVNASLKVSDLGLPVTDSH